MQNQIYGLNQLVVTKDKDCNEARTNGHLNALRAAENEKRFRDASQEADTWKNHASKIDREKSQELDAERNLRNSQVADLHRQHSSELLRQGQEKDALRGVIAQKHNDLESQKAHSTQLYS